MQSPWIRPCCACVCMFSYIRVYLREYVLACVTGGGSTDPQEPPFLDPPLHTYYKHVRPSLSYDL